MKKFTSKPQKTGELGESVACTFLERKGYLIVERNHTKKWGEIDIVAQRDEVVHFIEVKSTTNISRVTGYRPEENVHLHKQARLVRTIASYLAQNGSAQREEPVWQFDVLCVYLDMLKRTARVEMIEDIVLGA
ncbi:MAG TPA: YraN family protein [Candidatus Paceibacterota bacterium]|jgi:Predicted endonuclease distantly related to archaeal Holliday junction resolvase